MKNSGFVDSRFVVGSHDLVIILYSIKDKKSCNRGFDILVELRMFFFPHAYFALLKFQHRKEGSRKYDGDSDQI